MATRRNALAYARDRQVGVHESNVDQSDAPPGRFCLSSYFQMQFSGKRGFNSETGSAIDEFLDQPHGRSYRCQRHVFGGVPRDPIGSLIRPDNHRDLAFQIFRVGAFARAVRAGKQPHPRLAVHRLGNS